MHYAIERYECDMGCGEVDESDTDGCPFGWWEHPQDTSYHICLKCQEDPEVKKAIEEAE